jgi:membrane protease YdiL (CAAX protease family)
MQLPNSSPDLLEATPMMPERRGRPVLAWIVIWLLVLYVLLQHSGPDWVHQFTQKLHPPVAPIVSPDADGTSFGFTLQARYLVGLKELPLPGVSSQDLYDKADALNTGTLDQRMRFAILAGELVGPAKAEELLSELDAKVGAAGNQPTPTRAALIEALKRLYEDYSEGRLDAPSIQQADRDLLSNELKWFGQLALAPKGTPDTGTRAEVLRLAERAAIAILSAVALVGVLGFVGLIGLVFFLVFLFNGNLRRGFQCGSPNGGIYAETFAVWMLLFIILTTGIAWIAAREAYLICLSLASLLSLLALVWPVLRGVPWTQVRLEIGWTAGKKPFLEPFMGVVGYGMGIPLLVVGVLLVLALLALQTKLQALGGGPGGPESFSPNRLPVHPIVPAMTSAGWWGRVQILLIASVTAPFVEETMFRGVLYRHLREATSGSGLALSLIISATIVSFVFAVIHPQGLVAIPALMALAYTFCLLREWRGALIPCMVAHGLSNGLVVLLLMVAMGD